MAETVDAKSRFVHRQTSPPKGAAVIQLDHVRKTFGDLAVFKDLNLEFRHGDTTVIIGGSGCGKSVLLKHVIGIIKPDAGRVVVLGQDLATLHRAELQDLRLNFGMVFQSGALFDSLDVNANVGFLLYEHTDLGDPEIREIVRQKLVMVDLEETQNMMPEELSGGMKKRVALARAIAMDPHIILYDEPTTGLDPLTSDTITDLIVKIKRELQATSIVVTHDMAGAYKIADRIIMLYQGEVIIDDTPQGVQNSPDPRVQSFIRGDASLMAKAGPGGGKS